MIALVLASCGGGDAQQPQRLKEPDQGDENGIQITVRIRATDDGLTVKPRKVAAFLPFTFRMKNDSSRRVTFAIEGQQSNILPPRIGASFKVDGLRPGRVAITAGGRRAALRVVRGG